MELRMFKPMSAWKKIVSNLDNYPSQGLPSNSLHQDLLVEVPYKSVEIEHLHFLILFLEGTQS